MGYFTTPTGHDSSQSVIIAAIIPACFSTILVLLRFLVRWKVKAVGKDDWFILVALIMSLATSCTTALRTKFGLGKHIWTVSPDIHKRQLQALYAAVILYNVAIILVKMSILLTYRRIFRQGRMHTACFWGLLAVTVWGLAIFLVDLMPCVPISGFWDESIPAICLNDSIGWYVQSLVNAVANFCILLLPLVVVMRLVKRLPTLDRWLLGVVFGFGLLTCIISILHLQSLTRSKTSDSTWKTVPAACWSMTELHCAIVASCLLTLRPLVTCCGLPARRREMQEQAREEEEQARRRRMSGSTRRGTVTRTTTAMSMTRTSMNGIGRDGDRGDDVVETEIETETDTDDDVEANRGGGGRPVVVTMPTSPGRTRRMAASRGVVAPVRDGGTYVTVSMPVGVRGAGERDRNGSEDRGAPRVTFIEGKDAQTRSVWNGMIGLEEKGKDSVVVVRTGEVRA